MLTLSIVLGILLYIFLRKKKLGWALNLVFFLFMTILMLASLLRKIVQQEGISVSMFTNLPNNVFFAMNSLITSLLFTRPIRAQFQIHQRWVIGTITAAAVLAILFIPHLIQ